MKEGRLVTISFLSVGHHVCMFVVDDVLSKLGGFSFNKGKVTGSSRSNKEFLTFHRERDLYLSFLQVRIVIMFTSISI